MRRRDGTRLRPRSITLPCGLAAPAAGRRFARGVIGIGDEVRDSIELLISELVTNAVLHAHTDVELTISVHGTRIRVEVSDASPHLPTMRATNGGTSGYGLNLVEELADQWGTIRHVEGKTVWFEMSTLPIAAPDHPLPLGSQVPLVDLDQVHLIDSPTLYALAEPHADQPGSIVLPSAATRLLAQPSPGP